jgi:capsular polysaccharide biosynthesis protein
MFKNRSFKAGKALLFITSGLLFSSTYLQAWTPQQDAQLIKLHGDDRHPDWADIAKRLNKMFTNKVTAQQARNRFEVLKAQAQQPLPAPPPLPPPAR